MAETISRFGIFTKMFVFVQISLSISVTSAQSNNDWHVSHQNIVCGQELVKSAWIAGTDVDSWQACQALCAANSSCREFDYAASWNLPEYGYVESTGCPAAKTCYFRSDDVWNQQPGSGCNHTSGRRPELPPITPGPLTCGVAPSPPPTPPPTPPPKPKPPLGYQPNIIFILTDDQDTRLDGKNDAYSDIGSMAAMASLQKNFLANGVSMSNGFVATPICCPSRTETFTGRHLHNVLGGTGCMHADTGQAGGRTTGLFGRLTDLGYVTGLFGKVTNDQSRILSQITKEMSASYIDSPIDYNSYNSNSWYRQFLNGTTYTEKLGPNPPYGTDYQTSQIGNRSLAWIREMAAGQKPFFAYLGPHAPHYPAEPAPWYNESWPDVKIPITPNYNLSSPDKTQHIRQNPPLSALAKCWENQHMRDRWASLLSVDDLVEDLFNLINELQIENKTFVIYSSDHGYKQGQWRVGTSKQHPYETDIHVPLLFHGPGIMGGQVLTQMSGNIDIMPTILDLAGGPSCVPNFVDGKSLLPVLVPSVAQSRNFDVVSDWRDYWLAEYLSVGTYYNDHSSCYGKPECALGQKMPRGPGAVQPKNCVESNITGAGNCYFVDSKNSNSWRVLRILNDNENIAYVEYDPTFSWNTTDPQGSGLQWYELYDINKDPYQMTNLYATTDVDTKTRLHGLMVKYYACAGNATVASTCG